MALGLAAALQAQIPWHQIFQLLTGPVPDLLEWAAGIETPLEVDTSRHDL
jgi:hypothetical protein